MLRPTIQPTRARARSHAFPIHTEWPAFTAHNTRLHAQRQAHRGRFVFEYASARRSALFAVAEC